MIVLIQERHTVRLERMVQVSRHASIELVILLILEDCKCAIVAVFILLEIDLVAFVSVVFHCELYDYLRCSHDLHLENLYRPKNLRFGKTGLGWKFGYLAGNG